jgi:integrase
VRHVVYGYDLRFNGERERRYDRAWRSEGEAQTALGARLQELEGGQIEPRAERTLGALVDEYLAYKTKQGKKSLKEDRRILKTRMLPAFGPSLQVRRLTGPMIARYEQQRVAEVTAYTVANELGVLRHMLRLAGRWGYLEKVPSMDLPKRPRGRERYLDADEIERLLAASAESTSKNPYLRAIVTIAVNTGMRRGEILGLEWERVNLSTSAITISRTKNDKPRGVPINRAVYDALVALEPEPERRVGLLFTKRRNGKAWGQVRTAFESALRRAKITGFRFHDLRHTAASHLVMRGASLQDVKEILGHADIRTTLRYAHLSPAHLRSAVDRLDGLTPATEAPESARVGNEMGNEAENAVRSGGGSSVTS